LNSRRFAGRTVLITGASSGIGAALAREFARQGASLVLAARRLERLEALAGEIRGARGTALALACDVTRDGDCERVVEQAHAAGLHLDIVVANAGFGVAGAFRKLTLADYQRQFDTNVHGVMRTLRAGLADVQERRGSLVIIGSVAGHVAMPGNSAYAMSKFAVRALAYALRGELRRHGVSVTLISPGFVSSDIRRTGNDGRLHAELPETMPGWLLGDPARVARVIVRAVHRRVRERVVTGHGRVLVWVYRHAPWLFNAVLRIWQPVRRVVR
jgi:NADP-dependent 3-hydroxy acid dehydrogenase YdfG